MTCHITWDLITEESIPTLSELEPWVDGFIKDQQWDSALGTKPIVLLIGDMGAGKTYIIKSFVRSLYGVLIASSPSYALHHQYQGVDVGGGSFSIDHWDLYRLQNDEELESTAFWDLLQNKNFIFIEWADRLSESDLPRNRPVYRIVISREHAPHESRKLKVEKISANN